jgi:hypothetical protein
MKLAKLGGTNIMDRFKYATRYMDDICWINVGDPKKISTHIILGQRTIVPKGMST